MKWLSGSSRLVTPTVVALFLVKKQTVELSNVFPSS